LARILNIETSTEICSVALADDAIVLSEAVGKGENDHATQLTLLIKEVLSAASLSIKQIEAVSISAGPGSYTGLRIGTSTAKGICHALNIPLIAVPTLKSMVMGARKTYKEDDLFCPLIDARRMEIYTAVYDHGGAELVSPRAVVADKDLFSGEFMDKRIIYFGSGLNKCKPLLLNPIAIFLENFSHTAANMATIASLNFSLGEFVNLLYFEPEYIKPVHIIPSKGSGQL